MQSIRERLPHVSILLGVAIVALGCATATIPAREKAPTCTGATLAFESASITREARARLSLPPEVSGAMVTEVLPGGPAERGGIRVNDIVLEIGGERITTSCDVIDHAWGRTCDPVRVVVRRNGTDIVTSPAPVEALPFLEAKCAEGRATACFRAAWLRWSNADPDAGNDRALVEYESACLTGSPEACAFQGLLMMHDRKPSDDVIRVLGKSCDLGSGAGCAHFAFIFATGTLVDNDDARATPIYVRACDLGDASGCYNAGLMYESGRGVPADLVRAASYYDDACRGGYPPACTNLGYFYENGQGVAKDPTRAVALYQRGCDRTSCQASNLRGCVNTGRAYRDGIGVAKDPAKAAAIFEAACNRKIDPDDTGSSEEQPRACSLLGALYLDGNGVGQDYARGLELSARGCGADDAFGCYNAAVVYASSLGVPHDLTKAAPYYRRACELDDAESCYELGVLYQKGAGVQRDAAQAAVLFDQACRDGFEKACRKSTPK